jgi:putative glycosyltransferase (TIGR04372 family)
MAPLNMKHQRLIDLSSSNNLNLELELVANCDGYIGSNSGPEALTLIFNKKKLIHNAVASNFYDENLHVLFKGHYHLKTKKYLNYEEININSAFGTTNGYIDNNILLIENNPIQLLSAIEDFIYNKNNHPDDRSTLAINHALRLKNDAYIPSLIENFNLSKSNYFFQNLR